MAELWGTSKLKLKQPYRTLDTLSLRVFRKRPAIELGVDEAIIDGEMVAADETGRSQFYDFPQRARRPSYVAFDLL